MKLKWGILGVAKIAINQLIPAIIQSELGEVWAIASRNEDKARQAAERMGIPNYYGSYEALLEDPQIDVIYNPLPNHLHVPWIEKCLKAGKHVLCEKPLALNRAEVEHLIQLKKGSGLKVSEAFMVKSHPQWDRVRDLLSTEYLGKLQLVHGHFTYNMTDMDNVRYNPDWGGGGLYDVGVYPIFTTRHALQEIPTKVFASLHQDRSNGVDVVGSGIIEFPSAQLTFSCGMQVSDSQILQFYGTNRRLDIRLPFNPTPESGVKLEVYDAGIYHQEPEVIILDAPNQYTLMCDQLARSIMEDTPEPVPLEDTLINTAILDALFESDRIGRWVEVKI